MWAAIKYVSSAITLAAFLFALAAWLYKSHLLKRERLIKSVPEDRRDQLVERTLVLFKVDPSNLNQKQQYNLALSQISEQAKKYRVAATVIVIIAILAAALTFVVMLKTESSSSAPPVSSQTIVEGNLSGEIEEVKVIPGQGGGVQVFIHLSIKNNAQFPTGVHQYAIRISHASSKSIEYKGPPEEITGRYTIPQIGENRTIVIQPQDSIISKTQQAIGFGQKVSGWLRLPLPLPDDVLRQAGIRYTVSFADVTDKTYQVDYEMR